MPEWRDGCTTEIDDTTTSNIYKAVDGSPSVSEYDIFYQNGLEPAL